MNYYPLKVHIKKLISNKKETKKTIFYYSIRKKWKIKKPIVPLKKSSPLI